MINLPMIKSIKNILLVFVLICISFIFLLRGCENIMQDYEIHELSKDFVLKTNLDNTKGFAPRGIDFYIFKLKRGHESYFKDRNDWFSFENYSFLQDPYVQDMQIYCRKYVGMEILPDNLAEKGKYTFGTSGSKSYIKIYDSSTNKLYVYFFSR